MCSKYNIQFYFCDVEWHLELDCNLQNKTHLICEALKLKALDIDMTDDDDDE